MGNRKERTTGRGWLCASLGGVLLLVTTSTAAAGPGLRLALERDLASEAAGTGGEALGLASLRRQVGAVRTALESARAANAEQAREVARAERRAAGLARLNAAQTRALDVLESLARAQAVPAATARAVAAPAVTSSSAPSASMAWLAGASIPDLAPSWGSLVSGLGALAVVGIAGFGAVRGRRLAGPPQGSTRRPRGAARPEPAADVSPMPAPRAVEPTPARPSEPTRRPRPAAAESQAARAPGEIPAGKPAPTDAAAVADTDGSGGMRPGKTRAGETRPEDTRPKMHPGERLAALRELDTLIAFEDYAGASRVLAPLVAAEPDNAEYRLRLAHIEAQRGNAEASDRELEVLSAMMDGPLSDTLARVRRIGRDLMPGNPAFDTRASDVPEHLPGAADKPEGRVEEPVDALLAGASGAPRAFG